MERFNSERTDWLNRPEYPQCFKKASNPEQKKYVYNKHRLVINSWDRDRFLYSNPNEFKINLPCRYRNVAIFEIDYLTLPNFSTTDYYFLVQVKEIDQGPYESLDSEIVKSMALIPNKTALSQFNYIYEAPGDTSYVKNFIKKFVDTPIASLETLTVKICKKNGSSINFGYDMLPHDHLYDFNSSNSDYTNPTLTLHSPNHGLGLIDGTNKDLIQLYNVTITDTSSYPHTATELHSLNKQYEVSAHTASNSEFKINILATDIPASYTKYTIQGTWKRVSNSNGWYSRNKINSVVIDPGSTEITITTTENHYLKKYDRIYISDDTTTITPYNNNHHIVTDIDSTTVFKISKGNIALDDITTNVPDYVDIDDDNLIDDTVTVGPLSTPFGYIQRYGEYDPTIQNQMIISITCRDEDDSEVRSDNISYGTHF